MVTDWRDALAGAVEGAELIYPARGESWFEEQCKQMDEADVCFALIDMEARHIGTIAELSAFRVTGKPRILVITPERAADRGYVIAVKLASDGMVFSYLADGVRQLKALIAG